LIEKLGGKEKIDKSWFKGGHNALDYKIRIISQEENKKYLVFSYLGRRQKTALNNDRTIRYIPYSLYFAQEEEYIKLFKNTENDELVINQEEINKLTKKGIKVNSIYLEIICFIPELKEILSKYISSFFIYENFGTRQNKGFGCFEVDDNSKKIEDLLKQEFDIVYKYLGKFNTIESIFGQIKNDYTLLKSGINDGRGTYEKSKLFEFFANREPDYYRWEKRVIKRALYDNLYQDTDRNTKYSLKITPNGSDRSPIRDVDGTQDWNDPDTGLRYAYIRALLGLAQQFEFQTFARRLNRNIRNYYDNKAKYVVKLTHKDIERFKSPIVFKIYNNTVYLCAKEIDFNEIFGEKRFRAEFWFKYSKKFSQQNHIAQREIRLPISLDYDLPVPTQISLSDILRFAFEESTESITNWQRITHEQ
jgi:hypothetical protein